MGIDRSKITGIEISPPSSRLIHIKVVKYLKKILDSFKIKAILCISTTQANTDKIMVERITALLQNFFEENMKLKE